MRASFHVRTAVRKRIPISSGWRMCAFTSPAPTRSGNANFRPDSLTHTRSRAVENVKTSRRWNCGREKQLYAVFGRRMGGPAGRSQRRTSGQPDGNLREKDSALAANRRTLCRQIWREVPYPERGRGRMVCEDKVYFVK